ncbi:hypothetical protein LZ30DRAFT_782180 [Colletotrichum cereale]|nr:hypothetical protein LZ30DRAFT_782180 [Colletotrichum cereale]
MMGNGFDSTPAPGGMPCEVLRMAERPGGAQTTVDRVDLATGNAIPFYALHTNKDNKTITVVHAGPRAQASGGALGTANAHSFDHHGRTYSWSVSDLSLSMNTLCFKDAGGNLLARWKQHPVGMMGASAPTFEVFVPPQSVDMDMLIVTGLAVIEYWAKYKEDSYKEVGEALVAM